MLSFRAQLFYTFALLAVVSCMEFHAGHEAVHHTELSRRSREEKEKSKSLMRAKNNADEAIMNITTAIQDYRTEYVGTIGVGKNADGGSQFEARVVFDTGSTNLWVASHLCTTGGACTSDRARQFYDPQKSTTQESMLLSNGKTADRDIDVHFGTGELIGPLHVDTFSVGPFELLKQPFAMIRKMNGQVFQSFPFEGILGLGFKDMSIEGIDPFFDRVIEQKVLTHNEFAFFMNVDSNKPSALLWGGIDKDLYHGSIRMFPVVQPHYWSLELVDLKMGNTSIRAAGMKGDPVKRLIVDSGTTYFTAPPGLHNEMLKRMPSGDCSEVNDETHPPLVYVLKGADGETYELAVSQETYMIRDGSICFPAFMSLKVSERLGPGMLLGEVFMKHFFTVFDRGNGDVKNAKVGFAPANLDAVPKVKPSKDPSLASAFIETKSISMDSKARMQSSGRRDIRQHIRQFD